MIPSCHPQRPYLARGLCAKCYRRAYFLQHISLWRQRNRNYRTQHPGQERERHRKYREKNRERTRQWNRQYYWRKPEKLRQRAREWRIKHEDLVRERRKSYHLKELYGLSLKEYENILTRQDGKCAVCKRAKPLQVDHDHASGKVRGLLCHACNLAVAGIEISKVDPIQFDYYVSAFNSQESGCVG